MWNRMMEYMDDRKRVYRFTDWGFPEEWKVFVRRFWLQWVVDLREFLFL